MTLTTGGREAPSAPVRFPVLQVLVLLLLASPAPLRGQDGLTAQIQRRVEAYRAGGVMTAAGMRLNAAASVATFYERRGYAPVWHGDAVGYARRSELLEALRGATDHGLAAADYGFDLLVRRAPRPPLPDADSELLHTHGFLLYGSHLLHGRVNPESVDPEWTANRRQSDLASVLENAVTRGNVAGSLAGLAPQQVRYRRLQQEYARFRQRAEEPFTPVPEGPRLELGATGVRVARLAARLVQTGDLSVASSDTVFLDHLESAVRSFQERWGLDPDGVVGAGTLAALNRSPDQKADQVRANLERWRWLPDTLGSRHVEVNIADFRVDVVEGGIRVLSLRAIVGRHYRETPMFSGMIRYLVLSPYWHVPPTIAIRDKFPLIRADPGYVGAQHMTLFDQASNQSVDPASVDFSDMSGSEFNRRFRLRQEPGPWNALGRVKFMFPNRHNVYLHDTPSRELFDRSVRAFSSGCIRIDDPMAFAQYLLRDQPQWTQDRIVAAAESGSETTVTLTQPVPVHLLYWTAWIDPSGGLQLRPDLYGRDARVLAALDEPPPSD